jgi:HEAT repeat protein
MWRTTFVTCLGGLVLAGGALTYMGQTNVDKARQIADAIAGLKSDKPEEVIAAAETLEKIGADAKEATAPLTDALKSDQPRVRAAAARALGAIGPGAHAAVPALIECLDDEGRVDGGQVWMFASRALGDMGPAAVKPMLEALDRGKDSQFRGIGSALHDIGPDARDAVPALITIVESNDENIIPALFALQGIGADAKDAVPALVKALENEDFHTQYWACRVLGAIGPQAAEASPHLANALRKGITSVRRNAATALGNIGPSDESVTVLTEALDDPLQFVRDDAVIALGKYGSKAQSAVPKIKEMLQRPSLAPRSRAAGALWRIDPSQEELVFSVLMSEIQRDSAPWDAAMELGLIAPDAGRVDEVLKLLDAEKEATREYAAEAAGWMGKHGKPALPRLKQLVNDSDQHADVRDSAREAIFRIEEDLHESAEPAAK